MRRPSLYAGTITESSTVRRVEARPLRVSGVDVLVTSMINGSPASGELVEYLSASQRLC